MSLPAPLHLDLMLAEFCQRIPGVTHAVVAAVDGLPVAHNLPDALRDGTDPEAAAAMVAATLGLGQRLVALVGQSGLQEAVMRSQDGYVLSYAIGSESVLTVFATATVNLARTGIEARELVAVIKERQPSLAGA